MRPWMATIIVALVSTAGCTHTQLRNNTVNQSETVSDIYTQQVLDNLAMFVYDSNSLPFFAFPNQGTNQVTDKGAANFLENFHKFGLNADREMQQAWTTEPVRDPHKLALMRCAYQHAVATCLGGEVVSRDCPECNTILDEFYGDSAHKGSIDKACVQNWKEDFGWFGMGCEKDVPEDCGCVLVGHHCDQYVWVLPGSRDKLTQLTLAILDYAVYEAAKPEEKEVVVTIERDKDDNIVKTTRQETYKEPVTDEEGKVIFRSGGRTAIQPSNRGFQLRLNQLK